MSAEQPEPEKATHAETVESVEDAPRGPYRNLFVPLVVVPAMIVMVLVLVFVLFGEIAGTEASLGENLDRVRYAGANERTQALFHVVQQVEENWGAIQEGRELPWPVEGEVLPQLERAWEETAREDASFRYVLAAAITQMDAGRGLDKMLECLEYSELEDEGARIRFSALLGLAPAARRLDEAERERVVEAVLPFLGSDDHGLQVASAAVLQGFPGEPSVAALRGVLADGSLELRGQAAVSLSHLGDPAGSRVLWELVASDTYAREREAHPGKWGPREVQDTRTKAVEALVRLGRPADLERLRAMARDEPDLEVREAAMRGVGLLERGASEG